VSNRNGMTSAFAIGRKSKDGLDAVSASRLPVDDPEAAELLEAGACVALREATCEIGDLEDVDAVAEARVRADESKDGQQNALLPACEPFSVGASYSLPDGHAHGRVAVPGRCAARRIRHGSPRGLGTARWLGSAGRRDRAVRRRDAV